MRAHIEGNIAVMEPIVMEVLLDHVGLVAGAYYEVVEAISAVDLHDVPEDWLLAHFCHRLRTKRCFFGKPCAKTAGKDDDLHEASRDVYAGKPALTASPPHAA